MLEFCINMRIQTEQSCNKYSNDYRYYINTNYFLILFWVGIVNFNFVTDSKPFTEARLHSYRILTVRTTTNFFLLLLVGCVQHVMRP